MADTPTEAPQGRPDDCLPDRDRPGQVNALWRVLLLTAAFMVAEVVGGLLANSLALLADAGHMLTDVAAVGLALIVARMARRPATPEKTFGYLRLEILAALVNGSALFVIAGSIVWEAIERLGQPPEVDAGVLLGVATGGLLANLLAARWLHAGHDHSLNVRGAYLHVLSDLLGSVGAIAAGLVIMATGWVIVDPIVSVAVALLILHSAWRLVRESTEVLLEATPRNIDVGRVTDGLESIPGVREAHDIHVWTVTSNLVAMSGHLVVTDPGENQRVLEAARDLLHTMGMHHTTIQVERPDRCGAARP